VTAAVAGSAAKARGGSATSIARILSRSAAKLLRLALVVALVTVVTAVSVDLVPGDPARAVLGPDATAEEYARVRSEMNLDRPVHERYLEWMGGAVRGDLGQNLVGPREDVSAILARAIPVSLELAGLGLLIALLLAIPTALLAARRPGGWFDRSSSVAAFGLLSVPSFLAGFVLISVFAVKFHVLPDSLWVRPTSRGGWSGNLRHALLPALAIGLNEAAVFARLLRNDLLLTMQEDYVLAARAKGMPQRHVLLRDALRPSSLTLLTVTGLSLGRLIGGTIVVETLFSLPGLGNVVVEAATSSDFPVVQGAVLVLATGYVLVNALVDGIYHLVDPRIRRG
jgi:peptide/nickel transport system permease protein